MLHRIKISAKRFGYILLIISALCLGASAATITVTNTNDSGAGSLRQAIADAEPGDTITFGIKGTITLTSGQLLIDKNLTIQGPGANQLSINGNNASRVFLINSGVAATLVGMTVRDGFGGTEFNGSGGGIYNLGVLTVSNSIVTNNVGGRGGGGTAGHGGGIYNGPSGTLTISNTTVHGNSCQYGGGGIMNDGGTLTVTNSTIFGNSSVNGGGITNSPGSLTVSNSTISGNGAYYGGAIQNAGPLTATNSTIVGNYSKDQGGGISTHVSGVTLRNTIVSDNTTNGVPNDIWSYLTQLPSQAANHSLIGDAASSAGIQNGVNGNIVGVNPMLEPLENNGGPTLTHALLSGSPAINAGSNCVLTANGCGNGNPALPTDQRDMPRNGNVDIGAFERQNNVASSAAPFDFDGDRKTDVSVFRPSDSTWYLDQSTEGFEAVHFGLPTDKIAPGDYDGDGKTDIAVFRDGIWYWLRSSDNSFRAFQWGLAGDTPVPADYNGDGQDEIAIYRDGTFWMYDLVGGQISYANWGLDTVGIPVPADYNGDGQDEVAVFKPEFERWFILWSFSGGDYSRFSIGPQDSTPVPLDYDGDGWTDIATYHSGNWRIRRRSDGEILFKRWGHTTDIPVPGDYDGDGKADITVYRNGIWYIVQSSDGGIDYRYFGLDTDIPVPSASAQ